MNLKELTTFLKKEPAFRLQQIKKAVFQDLIEDWSEVTTLPQELRLAIAKEYPLIEIQPEEILTEGKDQLSSKVLFKLSDGLRIESVLMRHADGRNTVCLSCQVGCAMNCQFCATGQQGFARNLTSWEMTEQVLYFARQLKKKQSRVSNIVFMGMGEPFLNYDNVLESIRVLNDEAGFNLGARHISISTCGLIEGIEKLAQEKLQVNLAISLHASNNKLRDELMPVNKKYPIEKVLAAVDNYIIKTKRRVMFEYLMINQVNDSPDQAMELAKLLKKPLYFVNLISFNPVGHSKFASSTGQRIKAFREVLEKQGLEVTQRYRFGQEIKAACGQLAGQNL